MYKLTIDGLHKSYGDNEVLKGVSLKASSGVYGTNFVYGLDRFLVGSANMTFDSDVFDIDIESLPTVVGNAEPLGCLVQEPAQRFAGRHQARQLLGNVERGGDDRPAEKREHPRECVRTARLEPVHRGVDGHVLPQARVPHSSHLAAEKSLAAASSGSTSSSSSAGT